MGPSIMYRELILLKPEGRYNEVLLYYCVHER